MLIKIMFSYIILVTLAIQSSLADPVDTSRCPPTLSVDICEARCGPESPCSNAQVCCPTECNGSMCVDPVTKRHFQTQDKPGKCPEFPRGAWICSHMCTSDGDCPRKLKCCTNRCGAQTCQMPDAEEVVVPNDGNNYLL